ncbi:hypothetical protein [Sulfuricella denitrificans]|nr:hypothetical protein [Sulfuricella denitrificans]
MPFRIDNVSQKASVWYWRIKGIDGRDVYGTLSTGQNGRGLYQVAIGFTRILVVPERFYVPSNLPSGEACLLLALTLEQMDWGPEVNQDGEDE